MAERRSKRAKKRVDYRELASIKLPRAETRPRYSCSTELFPVRVLEQTESRMKIHYVGYSSKYDEWRDESEVETNGKELLPVYWLDMNVCCGQYAVKCRTYLLIG